MSVRERSHADGLQNEHAYAISDESLGFGSKREADKDYDTFDVVHKE